MAHGLPDWGLIAAKPAMYAMDDLGEAVARLGSANVWDRRGNVLLLDDFSHGLDSAWFNPDVPDTTYRLSTNPVMSPPYSLTLSGGFAAWVGASASWFVIPRVVSAYGFEVWLTAVNNVNWYLIHLELFTPAATVKSAIFVNMSPFSIAFLNGFGGTTSLSGVVPWTPDVRLFHVIKLVVDFEKQMYAYVIIDDVVYNLKDQGLFVDVPIVLTQIWAGVEVSWTMAGPTDTWIDRIIVTQNEPV